MRILSHKIDSNRAKRIKCTRKSNATVEPAINAGGSCCCGCSSRRERWPPISNSSVECAFFEAIIKCKLFTAHEHNVALFESRATECHHDHQQWYCTIDSTVAKLCHGLYVATATTSFRYILLIILCMQLNQTKKTGLTFLNTTLFMHSIWIAMAQTARSYFLQSSNIPSCTSAQQFESASIIPTR